MQVHIIQVHIVQVYIVQVHIVQVYIDQVHIVQVHSCNELVKPKAVKDKIKSSQERWRPEARSGRADASRF